MKILSIVGTRPNFMKIAPLITEFKKRGHKHVLLHTGQHYDHQMSRLFFNQLKLPKPDINLGCRANSLLGQTGFLIETIGEVLGKQKPDLVVVVGDVSSTFAGAFAAKQLQIPIAHVESGLRSFDWTMPEEINRVLTDRISDYLFTTEPSANRNLVNEGVDGRKVFFVGNVMIDTLLSHRAHASKSKIMEKLGILPKAYCVLTLHRPSNVDTKKTLKRLLSILDEIQKISKIVFPIHPRTKKRLAAFGLVKKLDAMDNVIITEPLGYLDFLKLLDNSSLVLTDSGGIQEETTMLGIPCITLRENTERPITVQSGTNMLVTTDQKKILKTVQQVLGGKRILGKIPPLWDGKAASRIAAILSKK